MTIWRALKLIWTVITFPILVLITLNFERIFQAHRWDEVLPDAIGGKYFAPFSRIEAPWVFCISFLMVGITVGFWLGPVLKEKLGREISSRRRQLISLGIRMQNLSTSMHHADSFSTSWERPHLSRQLTAELNIVMHEAFKRGIPVPPTDAEKDRVQDFLTYVGSRLAQDDELAAIQEATRLSR
jgi:hypothetical protein